LDFQPCASIISKTEKNTKLRFRSTERLCLQISSNFQCKIATMFCMSMCLDVFKYLCMFVCLFVCTLSTPVLIFQKLEAKTFAQFCRRLLSLKNVLLVASVFIKMLLKESQDLHKT
jgi:hypothetical protein